MNLIAMIGTVENIKKETNNAVLTIKVEKPFIDSVNEKDFFDVIDVNVNNFLFNQDLNELTLGTLIGLKGRIKNNDNKLQVVAEKIQVFA